MKKIACLFPGVIYTFDRPLLYYSWKLLDGLGWEIFPVRYGGFSPCAKKDIGMIIKSAGMALVIDGSARRKRNHSGSAGAACGEGTVNRLTPQDHSGSAAEGTVINMPEAAVRIFLQIDDFKIQQLFFNSPGSQRMPEKALKLIREDRKYTYPHAFIIHSAEG